MFDGFLRFQISEKWANLRFPLNIWKQKVFQLRGGFAPLTPLAPRIHHSPLDCGLPAGGKLTKWPAVSKRLDSTGLRYY